MTYSQLTKVRGFLLLMFILILISGCAKRLPEKEFTNKMMELKHTEFKGKIDDLRFCVIHVINKEGRALTFPFLDGIDSCQWVYNECEDNSDVCLWNIVTDVHCKNPNCDVSFHGVCTCRYDMYKVNSSEFM